MNELLVMSQIAGRRCAMPAQDVQSVIEVGAVAPVPRTPDHIVGITAMRSQTLTVIDCRRALGFDPDQWESDHRAIVATIENHPYAFRIDSIEDITTGMSDPSEVPGGFGAEWSRVANGMIETRNGPALLLDLSAIVEGSGEFGIAA